MKNALKFFAACTVLVCFAFALPKNANREINVVIDAGHGGKDHGAAYGSFTEKEIVNSIASKINALNTDRDVVIHFTRVSDDFVSLNDRVNAINELHPDLVLSLHLNFEKGEKASGMEFFANDKATAYAVHLENKMVRENGYKSRGVKSAPFYILKNSEAPAISFQMGFLSNDTDRSYLTNTEKQEVLATAVLDFIKELK